MAVPAAYFAIGPSAAVRLTENYKAIAADLGLSGGSATPITGKTLLGSGVLQKAQEAGRIRLQLRNGTSKRRKGVSVLCALDKMEEAPKSVIGKEFGTGWIIVGSGYPRKATFY
ncbi:hypothetical protein [Microcoleus sp. herbarium2]|jgi:hypothetical protein|uniref:hypothetical protein n=1 Tax=Microcoleus sp. herbarium2 TaxID=3055433 RepID=UPI002FD09D6A